MAERGAFADLRVYVVDNGGQWTHREWRVLKYLGVDTQIVENDTDWITLLDADLDGLVLSGGAPRVGVEGTLGNCAAFLEHAEYPILGICAGHQFIARHYGGDAGPTGSEFGATDLEVIPHEDADILAGVPETSQVWESHHDEVTRLPEGFETLAKSDLCGIQVMRSPDRRRFGLQFHPEVEHTEYGVKIFENFLRICRAARAEAEHVAKRH